MSRKTIAGDATRERILDVSLPLFAEHGYAGASTRMIAEAAGVNVATIAYHFNDKQGLYNTVIGRLHEDLLAGITPTVSSSDPMDLLRAVTEQIWAFTRSHRLHIRLNLRHVVDHDGLPEVVVAKWSEPLLLKGQAMVGVFRPDWDNTRRRLCVLSVMHVCVRFAVDDEAALRRNFPDAEDIDAVMVEWLVSLTAGILGIRSL